MRTYVRIAKFDSNITGGYVELVRVTSTGLTNDKKFAYLRLSGHHMFSNSSGSVGCAGATARHALEDDCGQHPETQGNDDTGVEVKVGKVKS